MEDQNHEQSQPTNPGRSRRKWLRWLAVPAAVAVLALVYQLTRPPQYIHRLPRPPELVEWTSRPMGDKHKRIRMVIPQGWEQKPIGGESFKNSEGWQVVFQFKPGHKTDVSDFRGVLDITVVNGRDTEMFSWQHPAIERHDGPDIHSARRTYSQSGEKPWVQVNYDRGDLPAFNRTYKQICNSLTIE